MLGCSGEQDLVIRDIVAIDDKAHALKQVIHEVPNSNKDDLSFESFDTITSFRKAGLEDLFIIFIDFFLSKGRNYGASLLPRVKCEHLICFSAGRRRQTAYSELRSWRPPEKSAHIFSPKLKDGLLNE